MYLLSNDILQIEFCVVHLQTQLERYLLVWRICFDGPNGSVYGFPTLSRALSQNVCLKSTQSQMYTAHIGVRMTCLSHFIMYTAIQKRRFFFTIYTVHDIDWQFWVGRKRPSNLKMATKIPMLWRRLLATRYQLRSFWTEWMAFKKAFLSGYPIRSCL